MSLNAGIVQEWNIFCMPGSPKCNHIGLVEIVLEMQTYSKKYPALGNQWALSAGVFLIFFTITGK